MAETDQSVDRLEVAVHDERAFVRVIGRGSFKVSTALKQFGTASIEDGCRVIVFDMAEGVGMDSTFMGVLAGLASRLKKKNGGRTVMVNLASRTRGLLATLGLDHLIEPYMSGSLPEEFRQALPAGGMDALRMEKEERNTTAKTMLEAHEMLVHVHPDNLLKFKDVLRFLREDLQRGGGGADESTP